MMRTHSEAISRKIGLSHVVIAYLERFLDMDLGRVELVFSRKLGTVGQLAAAHGNTIFLSENIMGLDRRSFFHVLAHEIAHIAQQARGAVRLSAAGIGRAYVDDALEAEANWFADIACANLPSHLPYPLPVALPFREPEGECMPYPIVTGDRHAPRDVDGWLARFNRFGRVEPELKRVLSYFSAQKLAFDSEKELVYLVRMVVEILRRPKVGGREVTVGIPYRGDGGGKAILSDVELVRQGTLCEVIVLLPPKLLEKSSIGVFMELEKNGFKALIVQPGFSLIKSRIDAVYISGGPHDHPSTVGHGRARDAKQRSAEAGERHHFEEAVISCATAENIPLLGVCGGSWRVAATLGAKIERLPEGEVAKKHAGPMNKPQETMHTVTIHPASMLDQIVRTDNYRNNWPTRNSERVRGEALELPVNSVHWAQSTFPYHSDTVASARDGSVTEAFETSSRHFQIGIQWHPEYAQNGLQENGVQSSTMIGEQHRRIMAALGDAATDGRAARILQRAVRTKLAVLRK